MRDSIDLSEEFDPLQDFDHHLQLGRLLVIMPIARVHLDCLKLTFPGPFIFYPAECVNFKPLNIVPNKENATSLAELKSHASKVDEEVVNWHTLVAFPIHKNWKFIWQRGHEYHLELIRDMSAHVDQHCLNFIRYQQCPINEPESLPARAGQLFSNPMMAGAVIYSHEYRESRIIGGAAFTHCITIGLGLPMTHLNEDHIPTMDEVGNIIRHALLLYRDILESLSTTSKFVQCLSLLEFLIAPNDYISFTDVSKMVARYSAKTAEEYIQMRERFYELTGKRDSNKIPTGFRTRIVHMGSSLEQILPEPDDRRQLFTELDGHIRSVIDHMLTHCRMTFDDYVKIRNSTLRPFEK